MKRSLPTLLVSICISAIVSSAFARELGLLKVLYIGDKGSQREQAFSDFLKKSVAEVSVTNRQGFDPQTAANYDVVLLDWPQDSKIISARDWGSHLVSPLGAREKWGKPTVLLGSAGLNLAVAWQLKGGTGCTCMDPLAFGLKDHQIFETPFKIDQTKTISIPTPEDFKGEIKEKTTQVLPLVDNLSAHWSPGWCSYANDFPRNPDVEFFCGGVNHKTPTAAGLWRQGNLLHFGFEQSPSQMNQTGQQILLNAIVYISLFSEDRPIAITPSVFAGKISTSRAVLARRLGDQSYEMSWIKDWFKTALAPQLWEEVNGKSRDELLAWVVMNGKYLHPNQNKQLEFDDDLRALEVTFDQPEFLDVVCQQLRGTPIQQLRARRLIERYLPDVRTPLDADAVAAWVKENRAYLFASDSSDYRWYVDPLAKRRGVPTGELRGVRRAGLPAHVTDR